MLSRTAALLLLCLSYGMCATLGLYQAPVTEQQDAEESPATDTAAVEAFEKEIEVAGGNIADSPEIVDAGGPVAEKLVATERVAESDNYNWESPAPDNPAEEDPVARTPAADEGAVKIDAADDSAAYRAEDGDPTADVAVSKEPDSDSGTLMSDAADSLAMEAPTGEEESAELDRNEIQFPSRIQMDQLPGQPPAEEEASSWGLNSIRSSFQTINGYFDSLVELVGGHNGVCQYQCRYGSTPQPRPGYQRPTPNGCSSSLVGIQVAGAFDLGIPVMTKCCDQLDVCYDTCGTSKYRCDSKFRWCLHSICSDLKKSLGFVSKVQACESVADALYNTVRTLGCRPYMNSQRAACLCEEEEKDEL
ncbi:group XIIB secretory phospholipase A2-like protein [Lampris incognitus]|uniref:group XIIB secretory phospholipase A2-like protein n=1 Tax=Lampris incognitus TaxID=2546036 RepID=UPI0024B60CB6|nr:group XIIB secretory phospholipase A2-like protein [Lampris incognitus]